jgi:hypothetical protein
MTSPNPQLVDRVGWGHPAVFGHRARERLLVVLIALVVVVLAFAASLETPRPTAGNMLLALAAIVAVLGVVALAVSTRYEITLAILAVYLGLLDGPLKLEYPGAETSAGRDVLIIAITAGMVMRLLLKRQRLALPPLSGWVLLFVAAVLIESFNPYIHSIRSVLGGYRQELEFVPFFFFGYLIMRSKQRFRQLFLLCGVIALANGLVATYQSRLSPGQVASWGPGYAGLVEGSHGTGRTYIAEGVAHVRPTGLLSDGSAGGSVGAIVLPLALALLAAGKTRRRWPALLCVLGALLAIGSSASRTYIIIAVADVVLFAALALIARAGISRALAGLMAVLMFAAGTGAALIAVDGAGILHREEGLLNPASREGNGFEVEKEQSASESETESKAGHLGEIPRDIADAPFGLGLGITGAASSFGGGGKPRLEEEKVAGGSAYNLLTVETGALGLFSWLGLSASVIGLGITRLRRIPDIELRLYLVGILTTFITMLIQGLSAPTLAVSPAGAFQWFAAGVLAYWIAGPGWAAVRAKGHAPAGTDNRVPATGGGTI